MISVGVDWSIFHAEFSSQRSCRFQRHDRISLVVKQTDRPSVKHIPPMAWRAVVFLCPQGTPAQLSSLCRTVVVPLFDGQEKAR